MIQLSGQSHSFAVQKCCNSAYMQLGFTQLKYFFSLPTAGGSNWNGSRNVCLVSTGPQNVRHTNRIQNVRLCWQPATRSHQSICNRISSGSSIVNAKRTKIRKTNQQWQQQKKYVNIAWKQHAMLNYINRRQLIRTHTECVQLNTWKMQQQQKSRENWRRIALKWPTKRDQNVAHIDTVHTQHKAQV